jgi:SAM-dependent methyltransferase
MASTSGYASSVSGAEPGSQRGRAINKVMDRADLFTPEARPIVEGLNELIRTLYSRKLYMTSWYGSLPHEEPKPPAWPRNPIHFAKHAVKEVLGMNPRPQLSVGWDNRGPSYEPLPGAADDRRIPWYLYWEIVWVLLNGPKIEPGVRVLDGGGTGSLFSCYMASLGAEVHSIDINPDLVAVANAISKGMGWKMTGHTMDMRRLDFPDEYFDHAYSICVFEHLDFDIRQDALREMARCLKPGGRVSLTFDYRSPAVSVHGYGFDKRERNRLQCEEDIRRSFLSTGLFELVGNQEFYDDGSSYLVHPIEGNAPYTFGAIFLRKK